MNKLVLGFVVMIAAAVVATNALHSAYVFVTGDLVDNPDDPVQDSVYRTRLAADIEAPVYAVPGNHDYYGFTREKQAAYTPTPGVDLTHCRFYSTVS